MPSESGLWIVVVHGEESGKRLATIAGGTSLWQAGHVRILFVSANRIGDAVITCGVIDSLIRRYPMARFTIARPTP